MPNTPTPEYHAARARECRAMAAKAETWSVRAAHTKLAELHAQAAAGKPLQPMMG